LRLRRIAAVGSHNSSPEAEAIVDSKISAFLFAPEYAGARRALAEGHGGDSRAMTLLVLEVEGTSTGITASPPVDLEPRVLRSDRDIAVTLPTPVAPERA
jgi:hypothetical protein